MSERMASLLLIPEPRLTCWGSFFGPYDQLTMDVAWTQRPVSFVLLVDEKRKNGAP